MTQVDAARKRFLNQSANLLVSSSPSTSAFLSAQTHTLFTSTPGNFEQVSETCIVCGSQLNPELATDVDAKIRIQKSSAANVVGTGNTTRLKLQPCHTCGRTIKNRLLVQQTTSAHDQAQHLPAEDSKVRNSTHAGQNHGQSSEGRLSGKKRAKARKERQGLQALLDKSKKQSATAPSLNLMDFLKG